MSIDSAAMIYAEPGTADYESSVAVYNLGFPLKPGSAFTAHTSAEVSRAVNDAAAEGVQLLPITTGHASPMLEADERARIIRTDLQQPVRVDGDRGVVHIPAGALWRDVVDAAAPHGLGVPHGSSGSVGAVGFLLGGGMSLFGRAWGVPSNRIASIRVVTADGIDREVSAAHGSDLFWALRGGGGGFGIVTEVTLRLERLPDLFTGVAAWSPRYLPQLLDLWRQWIPDAPRTVTTSFRLLNLPPAPGVPPAFASGPVVALDGTAIDSADLTAEEAVSGLLSAAARIAEPLANTWHRGPIGDALLTHGDPPVPVASVGDSFTIDTFDQQAAAVWLDAVDTNPRSALMLNELRQLGGAMREPSPTGGAYDHLDADVLCFAVDVLQDPADVPTRLDAVLSFRQRMKAHVGVWTAPTMVDHRMSPRRSFAQDVEDRVQQIRARVDPGSVFALDARHSQS